MSAPPSFILQPAGASPRAARTGGRAFVVCAAIFLIVATGIAAANVSAPVSAPGSVPVARGWWLVAYLGLVGGVAQLLLGPGLIALARHTDAAMPGLRHAVAELVLWNVGTAVVALADLAAAPEVVLGGSVLLLAALILFTVELRGASAFARRPAPAWRRMYALLLVFLAASVVVGTVLAYRGHA
jgi:hypothetical protein